MKALLPPALLLAMLALSLRAQDPQDPALKIIPTWIHGVGTHNILFSIWNTGDTPVTLSLKISFTPPNPPKDSQKPTQDDDAIRASIEFAPVKAGQAPLALPVGLSPESGGDPVQVPAGKSIRSLSYFMGDDFFAALKASGSFTCRATYRGKVIGETSFDEKGNMIREYDARRHIIATYFYDDAGKRIGQLASLPDDPDLRAALAAKEKDLLARLKVANESPMPPQVRNQPRDMVLHDLLIFYTCESLEFDKAANLQFTITDRADIYNLKLSLACAVKTYEERNKNLAALAGEFPDKKAFTENLMVK